MGDRYIPHEHRCPDCGYVGSCVNDRCEQGRFVSCLDQIDDPKRPDRPFTEHQRPIVKRDKAGSDNAIAALAQEAHDLKAEIDRQHKFFGEQMLGLNSRVAKLESDTQLFVNQAEANSRLLQEIAAQISGIPEKLAEIEKKIADKEPALTT